MIELHGQVTTQRLHGQLNVVPNEGSTGGPLQSKTVHPSHDEQIITPDEDYYGLAVVKVEPVPRVPACFADTGYQLPNVVQIAPVNIVAAVSVEVGGMYLYNGVKLPKIPESLLTEYPYAFIGLKQSTGQYQILASAQPMYFGDNGYISRQNSNAEPYIYCAEGDDVWTAGASGNYGWSITEERILIWSNHDLPNGSADATDIYFAGSEPVPID